MGGGVKNYTKSILILPTRSPTMIEYENLLVLTKYSNPLPDWSVNMEPSTLLNLHFKAQVERELLTYKE